MTEPDERSPAIKTVNKFFTWPAAVFGPLVSTVGGAVIPLSVTPDMAGWAAWLYSPWWTVAGTIALLAGIAWSVAGARKREAQAESLTGALAKAKDDAVVNYTHLLAPLIHDLGNLADSQNVKHGRDLANRGLSTITKIIDVPRVRACMYSLDFVESRTADSMDIPNALTLRTPHEGRYDHPRPNFVRNESDAADQVFKVIDDARSRLVEDVDDPRHNLDCSDKEYKTFLNVPVKFQTEELGVLSVDAPNAQSLKKSHVLLAEMVAELIAVGILREQKHQRGRKPPQPAPVISE